MFIDELLVDPASQQKLKINRNTNTIENLNLSKFEGRIQDNIPVVLPKGEKSTSTHLHEQSETNFNYVEHYTRDAEAFDYFQESAEITENERHRLNQLIVSKLDVNGAKVLDVGCGNGWLSKSIQSSNNHVVSLDISLINVKKVLAQTPHANHSGLVADVFNLPIPDNNFDAIVASEIIEHIYDPKKFIDSLLKVLKPNGKLIITTPYNEKIPLHLCIHCNKPTPENAHLHSFNEHNVPALIRKDVQQWRLIRSSNKHLIKLRVYWLLRGLPFRAWRFMDRLAVGLLKAPTRLLIEITK